MAPDLYATVKSANYRCSLQAREGPVQFEKDSDPFNIDGLIRDATGGAVRNKRYGIEELESRSSKRARVDDD